MMTDYLAKMEIKKDEVVRLKATIEHVNTKGMTKRLNITMEKRKSGRPRKSVDNQDSKNEPEARRTMALPIQEALNKSPFDYNVTSQSKKIEPKSTNPFDVSLKNGANKENVNLNNITPNSGKLK
jgi:hypothetical protein